MMFSGFWSWFWVFVLVVAIFSADRLPEWGEYLKNLVKGSVDAVKKKTENAQKKIAQIKDKKKEQSEKDKTE